MRDRRAGAIHRIRLPRVAHALRSYRGFGGGVEFLERLAEFVAGVEPAQRLGVARAAGEVAGAERQRHVGADGDQLPVQRQPFQHRAQVVADLAADRRGVGDHAVQRAVLAQPLGGGLGAALVHPGHVVHAVAHQRQQVHHLVRAHAELLHHAGLVQHAAAHGVDQGDAGAHQLGEVLVAGGHRDLDALFLRRQRQRADHVVGLHALLAQDGKAQCPDDLQHGLDLAAQLVRHRRPGGLVLRIHVLAERRSRGIQHERQVVRLLLQRGTQHVDHAEQRAGGLALGIGQRRQRVERAIQIARSVDQDQSWHGMVGVFPVGVVDCRTSSKAGASLP